MQLKRGYQGTGSCPPSHHGWQRHNRWTI